MNLFKFCKLRVVLHSIILPLCEHTEANVCYYFAFFWWDSIQEYIKANSQKANTAAA